MARSVHRAGGATPTNETMFVDSEEEDDGIQEQVGRIRSTSVFVHASNGAVAISYNKANGDKRTITSRVDVEEDEKCQAKLPWEKQARVMSVAVFAALGSMLFGLDIGYIGPIIESDSFLKDVVGKKPGEHIDGTSEGLIVSLFSIGAMVTACPIISSYFLDHWGRKASIMVGAVFFIFGSLVQGTATSLNTFFAGRFVAGMSIGLLSSVIVLYQSELAPANLRGALSTLYQLGITFGILIAAFMDQILVDKVGGWRFVMALICMPAAGLLFGMMFMPRSPRWLVQQGRRKEALKVLLSVRGEEEAIQEELEIYQEDQKARIEGDPAWSELFQGRIVQLISLGVCLQLLQQLVGMNAFMYFGPKIFEAIGFSKYLFTTITNFVNFLSTFPAVLLADVAGRKSLMLWSSIGMTLSCTVMGITGLVSVTTVPDPKNPELHVFRVGDDAAGWVIAISAFFFVFNFAYGFGPIVWVYCAEIFPLRYRARAVGVCTLANWVGNFLIAQFTPMLLDEIQFSTFFVFAFFCAISIFVASWIPETKNVPLELVQQLFDKKGCFKSTARKGLVDGYSTSESQSDSDVE